ncbi:MAG: uroporphyrinogen decarboxylase family protein [Planctomycetota bacterium]|jgi:MtaA/CmuA family methyltransferase
MNGLKRYQAMLAGEAVDRLPCTPIVMQYAAEFIGSNYGAFAEDHRILVEANLRCAEHFGFDQVSCISDPYRETEGFGGLITYLPDGPPHCTAPLAESKDLARLQEPDPQRSLRMRDRVDAASLYRERCGGRYSILGWIEGPAAEAADLRGVTTFLYDLFDDELFACDLMDRCVEVGIAFAQAQIRAGADTVGMGDALASQLDPATYERLVQPREKRLVEAIHRAGARVKLHICGNITHLLPGIADLGVDILDVDSMVSLSAVREAVGAGTVLAGNMDPVTLIHGGSPESIREAVRIAFAEAGLPYMVNAGCEIPSGTPEENFRALCATVTV